MKWFKNAPLRWRLYKLKKKIERVSVVSPNRELCHATLALLDASLFRHYSPKLGLGINLTVQHPSIELLISKIKDSTRMVKEEKIIPADWTAGQELTVSLDRFLASKDGYYADHLISIRSFQQAGLELCEFMAVCDDIKVGLPEHNLRMLTKLFIDMRVIAASLLEVAVQL